MGDMLKFVQLYDKRHIHQALDYRTSAKQVLLFVTYKVS